MDFFNLKNKTEWNTDFFIGFNQTLHSGMALWLKVIYLMIES